MWSIVFTVFTAMMPKDVKVWVFLNMLQIFIMNVIQYFAETVILAVNFFEYS